MPNVFSKKNPVNTIENDYVGKKIFDTDIYKAKIKMAYIGKSQSSEAKNITLILDINEQELIQAVWVSNKEDKVTYINKNTKETQNIPGYNQINSLCLLVAGCNLPDMETEEKIVNIYDFEQKKQIPQSVECLITLHEEYIQIAVENRIIDKTVKNDSTGEYEPNGETRNINEIVKYFPDYKLVTVFELDRYIVFKGESFRNLVKEGTLHKAINAIDEESDLGNSWAKQWLKKNKNKVIDKSSPHKHTFNETARKKLAASTTRPKVNIFD